MWVVRFNRILFLGARLAMRETSKQRFSHHILKIVDFDSNHFPHKFSIWIHCKSPWILPNDIWVWVNTYRYSLLGDEHPFTTYFDVHQGYMVLTHSHFCGYFNHPKLEGLAERHWVNPTIAARAIILVILVVVVKCHQWSSQINHRNPRHNNRT